MVAFLFPGQGTQRIGMGAALRRCSPAAAEIFERGADNVDFDLLALCSRGPERMLMDTRFAQPAIFVTNAMAAAALGERGVRPSCVAGHSVGEISALWAAGVLEFEVALELVCRRAELMSEVHVPGSMAAISGLPESLVEERCAELSSQDPIVVGLYNAPQNVVVSGATAAVEKCTAWAAEAGARRVSVLRTSHAFHSPLMEEVAPHWGQVLGAVSMSPPTIPMVVNVGGGFEREVGPLRHAAHRQLTRPVEWRRCVETLLSHGVEQSYEVGDSRVLTGFHRMIAPGARVTSLADPAVLRVAGAVA